MEKGSTFSGSQYDSDFSSISSEPMKALLKMNSMKNRASDLRKSFFHFN